MHSSDELEDVYEFFISLPGREVDCPICDGSGRCPFCPEDGSWCRKCNSQDACPACKGRGVVYV